MNELISPEIYSEPTELTKRLLSNMAGKKAEMMNRPVLWSTPPGKESALSASQLPSDLQLGLCFHGNEVRS